MTHGNGPQVGLLTSQGNAYRPKGSYTLDVLGAETGGMIDYMVGQELGILLPFETPLATILTVIEVDGADPAFQDPTKFIGPVYEEDEADRMAAEKGWTVNSDGNKWRRVVPSPSPKCIFQIRPVTSLTKEAPL